MSAEKEPGLRERKRQETLQRITDAALKLFARQGFDGTTVDQIAAAAEISRRTFFHYFKTKDDILISMQGGIGEQIIKALADEPDAKKPLATLRNVMVRIASSYPLDELVALDKLMLASEAVQSRKQANYIRDEARLFSALRARWPDTDPTTLRLCAMLAIGITRLSLDAWREEGGKRHIVDLVEEAFVAFSAEVARL